MKSTPSLAASAAPRVDLPEPEVPTTETRRTGAEASNAPPCLSPRFPPVAANDKGQALSIGPLGNAADVFPGLLSGSAPINAVTDQTSAHDPLAYLPQGVAFGALTPASCPAASFRAQLATIET